MSCLTTSQASPAATSLQALPGGNLHCNLLAGPLGVQCGQEAALVSHSPARERVKGKKTQDTSGPTFDASSPSANLQRSLANKLRQRQDVNGSPEYVLTWKDWDMPSGPPICALRARARRISDSGFTGWPTPVAQPANGTPEAFLRRKRESVQRTGRSMGIVLTDLQMVAVNGLAGWPTPNIPNRGCEMSKASRPQSGGIDLQSTVQLVGWPTARAEDSESTGAHRGVPDTLTSAARLTGWATPQVADGRGRTGPASKNKDLGRDAALCEQMPGPITDSSTAATAKHAAFRLNPHFSRWLMGFPVEWFNSVDWAMLSSRKSQRRS